MSRWESIEDILTPEGIEKLNVGEVLTFEKDGKQTHLRIMQITKKNRVWAKRIDLISGDEMNAHYGHRIDSTEKTIALWGSPYCVDCAIPINQTKLV